MQLFIAILIILLLLVLASIAFYIVIQSKSDEEDEAPSIHQSGVYSLIRKSPREGLMRCKATYEDVLGYLGDHAADKMDRPRMEEFAGQWIESIEKSIRMVEEGDEQGIQTYRFKLTERDLEICDFLGRDSYISREQIYNHPELLPPYYIGCTCELLSKLSWEDEEKTGWKPILPVAGKYTIPDWKTIA